MTKAVFIKTENLILTRTVGNKSVGIVKEVTFPVRLITIRLREDEAPYTVFTTIDRIYLIPN